MHSNSLQNYSGNERVHWGIIAEEASDEITLPTKWSRQQNLLKELTKNTASIATGLEIGKHEHATLLVE